MTIPQIPGQAQAPATGIPVLEGTAEDKQVYERVAALMYGKMPVPLGVTRVPWSRLDLNAQLLWKQLAKAAIAALNEIEIGD